jgi:hypothetical protein
VCLGVPGLGRLPQRLAHLVVALAPHFLPPFLVEVLLDGCLVIPRLLARAR